MVNNSLTISRLGQAFTASHGRPTHAASAAGPNAAPPPALPTVAPNESEARQRAALPPTRPSHRTNPGRNAVVERELMVLGVAGLRVADAGVTVVSGNTNTACIMIGEKCADLMLASR